MKIFSPLFLCYLVVFILTVLASGQSVEYCLYVFVGKSLPFWVACILGLIIGEITIPLAIAMWCLGFCLIYPLF